MIQHHGAAKLVIGNNVGGLVALNMVIELLRLSLRTSVTSGGADPSSATGMAALNDLLPANIKLAGRGRREVEITMGLSR